MKKQVLFAFMFVATVVLLSSCVAHTVDIKACVTTDPAGFWKGLWHGIIAPVTFVISLFSDHITMYDINNNGNWYNFGFVLGAGIIFGGGKHAGKHARKNRNID